MDWRDWLNRKDGPPRELLLSPNRQQIKIVRYAVTLGKVMQGEVKPYLEVKPQVIFRIDRIVVHAQLPELVRLWWAWLFWWFAYPVLRRTRVAVGINVDGASYEDIVDIDDDDEEICVEEGERLVTRYKIDWRYPVRSHHTRRQYRAQAEALSHSPLVSLKIGGIETLIGAPISLFELAMPGGVAPVLAMPTTRPPAKIEAEFGGVAACTFVVACMGFSCLDENSQL